MRFSPRPIRDCRAWPPVVCVLLAVLDVAPASTRAAEIQFQRDIEPIFSARCVKCHGPKRQRSGLRVDQRASLLRGGDQARPAIVPGDVDESLLLSVVSQRDSELQMPPDGPPLSDHQVALLRSWVEQGAQWPGQMQVVAPPPVKHWSFQPIARPQVPHPRFTASGDSAEDRDSEDRDSEDRDSEDRDSEDRDSAYREADSIDRFVAAKLDESGLTMSPRADAITLLRRVSFVLTGLPPTTHQQERFLSDPGGPQQAYLRAVDRLLESPRYGERWAQHWLDVIRWAETVGFETNAERKDAWPYRDWVIDSLNADKPYDQFVFEQLAGDTCQQDAALGFLVAGPANLPGQIGRDEEAMRQARQDELDEVIRTVSQGFLGLTIECARCHNHKFDPILQRDYYAMQAIFAGLSYGHRRWRGETNDQWTAQIPEASQRLTRLKTELEALRQQHELDPPTQLVQTDSFDPVVAKAVRMEIASTENGTAASLYELGAIKSSLAESPASHNDSSGVAWSRAESNVALASVGSVPSASSFALANQTRHFDNLIDGSVDRRQAFPWVAEKPGPAWVQVDFARPERIDRVVWDRGSSVPAEYVIQVLDVATGQWKTVVDSSTRLPSLRDTRKAKTVSLSGLSKKTVGTIVNKIAAVRDTGKELARLKAGPPVYAASFSDQPGDTWLLRRGDAMRRDNRVEPNVPEFLGDLGLTLDAPEPSRRIGLARHLIDPKHPLTARVIVNRVWQQHFGAGLVDTPSDFGDMGSDPSHAKLLDWLAAEFVKGGWSLKQLHRRIVLSETFRQASRPRDKPLRVDADSRLLWRFPPRRLEAEAIRDSILLVSGKLNLKMGGPGFNLFKQRGGLSDYTTLETFDSSGWRRMIYAHKVRMQQIGVFGAFDCPDAGQMKPKRTRSITPTQSLSLFNSPFVIRQAGFFADRVRQLAGPQVPDQVDLAFSLALSRSPSPIERGPMIDLVREHGLSQLCRVLFNTSEFIYIQ